MYPGTPLKSKERDIPRSVPELHDSGNKREREGEGRCKT